ncbi:hypothetical protein J5491_00235 [Candidatus Saccharibacteria bacterium]|nr:hypothetical protein [Candidatus Saccharibacteria bacterium]
MNRKSKLAFLIALVFIVDGAIRISNAYARDPDQEAFNAQNNVLFYDGDECNDGDSTGDSGVVDVCDQEILKEAKEMLDNEDIRKKAKANLERYKYAEEKTGLPWQVLAVLHYNEASMASDQSITNGESLTDHTNVDGVKISSDPNEDAVIAANLFIENAKTFYDIDIVKNKSEENYGWAFLAYNRGGLYKCHGNVSYKKSPYVMNYYDSEHKDMKWIAGVDDTTCEGASLDNGVGGQVSKRPGALTVMAYLCGGESDGEKEDSKEDSKDDSKKDSNKDSDTDTEITLIGDSISVTSEKQLKEKFKNGFLSMVGSRHPTSKGECDGDEGGLSILEKLVKGSGKVKTESYDSGCKDLNITKESLRNNIVWELGTNPTGADEKTINKVIDLIGDRNLYLVTIYNGLDKTSADNINKTYKDVASKHDNVFIIDWNKEVGDDESKYITRSDGMAVHPTEEGSKLLVKLISEAISSQEDCGPQEAKYPEYSQCGDARWNDKLYPYPEGLDATYCRAGCGPSSMALIATYVTGKEILPTDIGNLTLPSGHYTPNGLQQLDQIVAEKYDLELVQFLPSSKDEYIKEMKKYLKDGYSLHILGNCLGSYVSGENCPFTELGHYVGVFEMTGEDTVMVGDTHHTNKEYKLSDIVNSGIKGYVSAFKGDASHKGCNKSDYCDGGDGGNVGPVKESMTVEQAQKLADNYNKNVGKWQGKVANQGNYAQGLAGSTCGPQCNCVLFSAFFSEMFTDMPFGNGWPDGGAVAGSMVSNHGFKGGTTPKPYSVFSIGGHTGVVVAVNPDGTATTIEAGYYSDAEILAGAQAFGATVFENKSVAGYTFAYLNDEGSKYKMDGNRLNTYLQSGKITE